MRQTTLYTCIYQTIEDDMGHGQDLEWAAWAKTGTKNYWEMPQVRLFKKRKGKKYIFVPYRAYGLYLILSP